MQCFAVMLPLHAQSCVSLLNGMLPLHARACFFSLNGGMHGAGFAFRVAWVFRRDGCQKGVLNRRGEFFLSEGAPHAISVMCPAIRNVQSQSALRLRIVPCVAVWLTELAITVGLARRFEQAMLLGLAVGLTPESHANVFHLFPLFWEGGSIPAFSHGLCL